MTPTKELRWYRYNTKYILQQKWVDKKTMKTIWKDIPFFN